MGSSSKKVLFINLTKKTSELKTFPDLYKYFGGVALGLRLFEIYQDEDPIIFSVGPLNGFFPFVSKTSVVFKLNDVIEDIYLGGYLSTRIKFSDLDAIILHGKSSKEVIIDIYNDSATFKEIDSVETNTSPESLGLPGKNSILLLKDEKLLLDNYFTGHEDFLDKKFAKKGVVGLAITGTKVFTPKKLDKYEEVYLDILGKTKDLTVDKGFFPSCSGCPMGCEKSKIGELGGNVLAHSLVACGFAEKIYTDVGTVFSCLNVLGYDYTHEDIENLPSLVQNTLRELG